MADNIPVEWKVIRDLGASVTHVAGVMPGQLRCFRVLGSPFIGVALPIATRCGSILRRKDSAAVCMNPGTKVSCRSCRNLSQLTVAPDGNHLNADGLDGPAMERLLDRQGTP